MSRSSRCCHFPSVDQASVILLSVETTGPLLNTDKFRCACGRGCLKCRDACSGCGHHRRRCGCRRCGK